MNTTNYTDITISNVKSTDEDTKNSGLSNNNIDRGVFEEVFVRTPIKSPPLLKSKEFKLDPVKPTDLKLESRPLLQVPSSSDGSSGIREIKVIHTKPAANSKITSVNGVKRFTNFQNSTSSNLIDGKSETLMFSASSSGSDINGSTHVLQKSFKQQMIFNNNNNQAGAGEINNNKLVNS